MPSTAPPIPPVQQETLVRLGERLSAARKRQKVTATAAAEAAGVSRMTLYRIERGDSRVTMGAWLAAADALGLRLDLVDAAATPVQLPVADRIALEEYPQLKRLAWQLKGVQEVTPQEALSLYERNWRHVDARKLTMKEIALINALATTIGGGRPLV